jgi:hypothetical protein
LAIESVPEDLASGKGIRRIAVGFKANEKPITFSFKKRESKSRNMDNQKVIVHDDRDQINTHV